MKYLKSVLKILKKIGFFFSILVILYIAIGFLFSILSVEENKDYATGQTFEIFITTNGIHADFTVPFQSKIFDWSAYIDLNQYDLKGRKPTFISFGWGDKNFYLETPTWRDLTLYNFCNAMFWDSQSAMHVTLWSGIPKEGKNVKKVKIHPVQYQLLVAHILNSFEKDGKGRLQILPVKGYSAKDRFYKAEGQYNGIRTCNNWVNDGLKEMELKTSVWSPFDFGIFYHLP
jgi:uncharacterized protein (TIGR02117 family)